MKNRFKKIVFVMIVTIMLFGVAGCIAGCIEGCGVRPPEGYTEESMTNHPIIGSVHGSGVHFDISQQFPDINDIHNAEWRG